jgi:hypothetical protein
MRRHVIPSILLFAAFTGLFYLLLNTPWLITRVAPRYIKHYSNQAVTVKLHIGTQKFHFPETLVFTDFEATVTRQDISFRINARKLTLYKFFTYLNKRQSIRFLMNGGTVAHGGLSLGDLNVSGAVFFQGPYFSRLEGIFAAKAVGLRPYALRNMRGQFRAQRNKFLLQEVSAEGYGGKLNGQMTLEFSPEGNYSCWLELVGLKPAELARGGPWVFSQLAGPFSGALRVIWDNRQISLMSLDLQFDDGGTIGPVLTQKILSYRDHLDVKETLKSLVSPDGNLSVSGGKLRIQNTGPYRLLWNYAIEDNVGGVRLKEAQDSYMNGGLTAVLFPEPDSGPGWEAPPGGEDGSQDDPG